MIWVTVIMELWKGWDIGNLNCKNKHWEVEVQGRRCSKWAWYRGSLGELRVFSTLYPVRHMGSNWELARSRRKMQANSDTSEYFFSICSLSTKGNVSIFINFQWSILFLCCSLSISTAVLAFFSESLLVPLYCSWGEQESCAQHLRRNLTVNFCRSIKREAFSLQFLRILNIAFFFSLRLWVTEQVKATCSCFSGNLSICWTAWAWAWVCQQLSCAVETVCLFLTVF